MNHLEHVYFSKIILLIYVDIDLKFDFVIFFARVAQKFICARNGCNASQRKYIHLILRLAISNVLFI